MKLTLISPYPDVTSFGVRTLSAYLRQHGHHTQILFLPDPFGDDIVEGVPRYDDAILRDILPLCRDSDLVGISLMTNFFDGAVQITRTLKAGLDVPVLWGGVHPTIRPGECLDHADMVCIGEGEDALLALADKMSTGQPWQDTTNLWCRRGASIVKNPLSPLPKDLDRYPAPDYSMEDHHVLYQGHVVPLTHEITAQLLQQGTVSHYLGRTGYQTMTSRGCPYNCAYCINDTIRNMYGGKGKLRWRSVEHVMQELDSVRATMPYVDYIWISDDEFMARPARDLEAFCKEYANRIKLPFSCLVSPMTVTEEKMAMLVEAGLVYVQMGVESGSARMQEIYHRQRMNNERMMRAIRIVNKFKDRMAPPSYDFLVDVPFETEEDIADSLRFISRIPKPYHLQPFSVVLYPGTHLHAQAMEAGLIRDERKEIYNKTYTMHAPTYLNLLMTLARGGRLPGPLLRALVSAPVVRVLNSRPLKPLWAGVYHGLRRTYRLAKRILGSG